MHDSFCIGCIRGIIDIVIMRRVFEMRLFMYQMEIAWEEKEKNIKRLEEQLSSVFCNKEQIKDTGMKSDHLQPTDKKGCCTSEKALVVLPEMSFTGFSMMIERTRESTMETVERMKELAVRFQVAIGFGWVKAVGEKAENHYTVVSHKGEILSDYIKLHPFSYAGEDEKFEKGNLFAEFVMEGIPFGSAICYDLRFPEVFQIESKKAHVIIVPANWPKARREHWITLLRARAIENQCYMIGINCVGQIGDLSYSGDSMIVNPNGEVVLRAGNGEQFLEYNLLDDVWEFRNNFPVKQDRRESFYQQFYEISQ